MRSVFLLCLIGLTHAKKVSTAPSASPTIPANYKACNGSDSQCTAVRVFEGGNGTNACCWNGNMTAVAVNMLQQYLATQPCAASSNQTGNSTSNSTVHNSTTPSNNTTVCPLFIFLDTDVPQCVNQTCQMVRHSLPYARLVTMVTDSPASGLLSIGARCQHYVRRHGKPLVSAKLRVHFALAQCRGRVR